MMRRPGLPAALLLTVALALLGLFAVTPPLAQASHNPEAPGNLRVTSTTPYTIVVEWDTPSDMTNVNRYHSRHKASSQSGWITGTYHDIGGANLRQRNFTNLNPGTSYDIEVRSCFNQGFNHCGAPATLQVTTPPATDYDADDDGLIEVANLAQLNAIRWDLDGDGSSTNSGYATAFPNPVATTGNLGCGLDHDNDANTAPVCTGYELTANLDFDTGTAGDRTDDTYHNSGSAWQPIGDDTSASARYNATFDGNDHTVANLFISRGSAEDVGLFGAIGAAGVVRNLGVVDAEVTGQAFVGALVGSNYGAVSDSYADGSTVTGTASGARAAVGGLVGWNGGTTERTHATAAVTGGWKAGGLVGINGSDGVISRSYAAGEVSAHRTVGGLVGENEGTIVASYASGPVTGGELNAGGLAGTSVPNATIVASYASGSVHGSSRVGGLVGGEDGTTIASYATGPVTGESGRFIGGLVGSASGTASFLNNYFDEETSGRTFGVGTDDDQGSVDAPNNVEDHATDHNNRLDDGETPTAGVTAKTTAELQSPTGYSGIYVNWRNIDLDNDGTIEPEDTNEFWNFGTASQYPALKADFNGDNTATWPEFGVQLRQPLRLTANLSSDAMQVTLGWNEPVVPTELGGSLTPSYVLYRDGAVLTPGPALGAITFHESIDLTTGPGADYQLALLLDGQEAARSNLARAGGYDRDGDGLIEITTLAHLDAVRYDLHGNGEPDVTLGQADKDAFETAFDLPAGGRVCRDERVCRGYELMADLDFDENSDGEITQAGDPTYWNSGSGWATIGDNDTPYNAAFEGNRHTIANLFISRATSYNGLFGDIGSSGAVRNVGVVDVNLVNVATPVGALAGENDGAITNSYATGSITAAGRDAAGGLVGSLAGSIVGSYASVTVSARSDVGGLVGRATDRSSITGSYATGSVSASNRNVGGLVGFVGQPTGSATQHDGLIAASYATGAVSAASTLAGGLIGLADDARIVASYATGPVTAPENAGGLVGSLDASSSTVTNSYYDTDISGQSGGTGPKTTSELQSPTGYSGIYANWRNIDLDSDANTADTNDFWHFGTGSQYPALKADFNGDNTASWPEFGYQLREAPVASISTDSTTVTISWTPVVNTHWTPNPALTYQAYKGDATLGDPVTGTSAEDSAFSATDDLNARYWVVALLDGAPAHTSGAVTPAWPGTPANVMAAANSSSEITLSWDAPTGTFGIYDVQQRPDSEGNSIWSNVRQVTSSDTTITTPPILRSGTTYEYRVRACATVERETCGLWSGTATATTQAGPPEAPTLSYDKPTSENQDPLRWTAPFDGGSAITDYEYRARAIGASWGGWTSTASTATSVSVNKPGGGTHTGYQYQVRAVNSEGDGAESNTVTVAGRPATVTDLTAAASATAVAVTLSWTAPSNGGKALNAQGGYRIEWRVDATGDWTANPALDHTTAPGNAASFMVNADHGLQPGTVYDFRIRADNPDRVSFYSSTAQADMATLSIGASIAATNPSPLTERTLHGATVTVDLVGTQYVSGLSPGDFGFQPQPVLRDLSVASVSHVSDTQVVLTLSFTGNIASDVELLVVVDGSAHTASELSLTTAGVMVTQAPPPAQVTGVTVTGRPGSLEVSWNTAANADGYQVVWWITGEAAQQVRPVSGGSNTRTTIGGLPGETGFSVQVAATSNFNPTLGDYSAIATGTTLPGHAIVSATDPSPLTERNLDGATLKVDLLPGVYDPWAPRLDDDRATVTASGVPGVTVADVTRVSDRRMMVTLASDDHDFDTDATLRVEFYLAHTSIETITAVAEVPAVVEPPPGPVTGLRATGGVMQVNLRWDAVEGATGYRVEYQDPGANWWYTYLPETRPTRYTIHGLTPGTQYKARVYAVKTRAPNGPVSAPVSAATIPYRAWLSGTNPSELSEGNLNGATISVDLQGSSWLLQVAGRDNRGLFTVSGVPGVWVERVERASPSRVVLTLRYNGTNFDDDRTLSLKIHGMHTWRKEINLTTRVKAVNEDLMNVRARGGDRRVDVSWDGIESASAYRLEWKETGAEDYSINRAVVIPSNWFPIRELKVGTHYTVRVNAWVRLKGWGGWVEAMAMTDAAPLQTAPNRRASVTVQPSSVSLPEGYTGSYSLVLDAPPTGNVVITVSSDNPDVAPYPNPITFTPDNWQTKQLIGVPAAHDGDAADDTATISHTVSGADGYAGIAVASVSVSITDDDTAGVTVTPTELSLNEGGSATYTVSLDAQPVGDVLISVFANGVTAQPASLTFTTNNWQSAQTVTVSAAQDDNTEDETAAIFHGIGAGPDSGYASVAVPGVVVSITDDDQTTAQPAQEQPGSVTVSETSLFPREGDTGALYAVKLDAQPTGNVTITVSSDNSDVTAQPSSLTFTPDNWQTEQFVTVSADEDSDRVDDLATISHTASGGNYDGIAVDSVIVAVTDDDTGREALRDLYHATHGQNWTNNANWLSDQPLGEWHGVTVNGQGRVTAIVLDGNNLTGSLPAELGKLQSLTRMALNRNSLTGEIPSELGNLSSLSIIGLARNSLSGALPTSLGNLSGLTRLSLHDNTGLSGPLPAGIGAMPGLTRLAVSRTGLSGELPQGLVNSAMQYLHFDGTSLCAPSDEAFQTWLDGVPDKNGPTC